MRIDRTMKTVTPPAGTIATGLMILGAMFSATAQATSTYLDAVNSYCGTSYDCTLCHTTPPTRNSTGDAFRASNHDPATLCPSPSAPTCTDADGDGFAIEGGDCGPVDCNDGDAAVNPGAVEICTNSTDDNCNGLIDTRDPTAVGCATAATCTDEDGDGYAFEGGACGPTDCDDSNAAVNPGAVENCTNGVDDNCNGLVDVQDPAAAGCATTSSACTDADGDGYATEGGTCGPVDSDDNNPAVNPAVPEDCTNGIDDNGNGLIDGTDPVCAACVPTARVEREKRACTDGVDNDCNGLVDCTDPSCATARGCRPARHKTHKHHEDGASAGSRQYAAGQESDDDND
jgi:hypothetical protein